MNTATYFKQLISEQKNGNNMAICSICSANNKVIEAAMEIGRDNDEMVLIEATANQVNQFGGYTGMQPADFVTYAKKIAEKVGLKPELLMLGGDHLGPLTWTDLPESEAMQKAEDLIAAYVKAGFSKIHLDTSMRVADDSQTERLPDETIAARAARLCAVAEANATKGAEPVYVIGSEVPIPGGATENEDELAVTTPQDLQATVETFRKAFAAQGLEDAWKRVIAVVVQPGVEFADNTIIQYNRDAAKELISYAKTMDNMVLEGHSTDYQAKTALSEMSSDGIAILKVGPALTFALREALFSLESMERTLYAFAPQGGYSNFSAIMEQSLMQEPKYWKKYYHGTEQEIAYARKYSLSDRCRYYLEDSEIISAISRLITNINSASLPFGLISQFFPNQKERVLANNGRTTAETLIKEHIKDVIDTYRN